MHKIFFIILIMLFVTGLVSFSCSAAREGEPVTFSTLTLDGGKFDIASLKGKVVLIHFWATWCSSCKEEMPVLEDFYLRYHAKDIEILGVSLNNKHERDEVTGYMKQFHFPASFAYEADNSSLGNPSALPVTYIIDPTGHIRQILTPATHILTRKLLEEMALPLLKQ